MTYHHSMGQLFSGNLLSQQFTQPPASTSPTDWRTPIVAAAERHLRAVAAARSKMPDWARGAHGALALDNATKWLSSARRKTLDQLRLQGAVWPSIPPLSMPASRYGAIAERDEVVASQAAAKASVQPVTTRVGYSALQTVKAPIMQITTVQPSADKSTSTQTSVQSDPFKTPIEVPKTDPGSQGGGSVITPDQSFRCPDQGALAPAPPGFEYMFTQGPDGCTVANLVPVATPPALPSVPDIMATLPANISEWRKNIARIIATTLGSLFSQGGPVMEAVGALRSGFEDLAAAVQRAFSGVTDASVSDEQVARGIFEASDKYKSAKSSIPSVVTQFADPVVDEILKSIPDNLKSTAQQPSTMLPQQQGGGLPWNWIIVGGVVVVGGYFLLSGGKKSAVTPNRRRRRRR